MGIKTKPKTREARYGFLFGVLGLFFITVIFVLLLVIDILLFKFPKEPKPKPKPKKKRSGFSRRKRNRVAPLPSHNIDSQLNGNDNLETDGQTDLPCSETWVEPAQNCDIINETEVEKLPNVPTRPVTTDSSLATLL